MVEVELTRAEIYFSANVGLRRWVQQVGNGARERRSYRESTASDRLFLSVLGAMGECAAAKVLGLYWGATVYTRAPAKDDPDIAPDWQVRTTQRADGDLFMADDDADDQRFVLVTFAHVPEIGPLFRVVGWILGRDGKRIGRLDNHVNPPITWVPQKDLVPINLKGPI